jgi:hypothetical protein
VRSLCGPARRHEITLRDLFLDGDREIWECRQSHGDRRPVLVAVGARTRRCVATEIWIEQFIQPVNPPLSEDLLEVGAHESLRVGVSHHLSRTCCSKDAQKA